MSKQLFVCFATGILSFIFLVSFIGAQGKNDSAGEGYHIQKGMEYYSKGFYEFAPKRQQEEASRNYELAVSEFQMAISVNPGSEKRIEISPGFFMSRRISKRPQKNTRKLPTESL